MPTSKDKRIQRPPVIVIMGHIDHGKSTLLDYIRKSNIVSTEAGGITQHIAAYEVVHNDKKITFLDTPGHEAFQQTRKRGVHIADIAILIVSAEDGVMPQTKEALDCILEDGLPYIVAINKTDSSKANIEKTKSSLLENEVYLEGLGGQISYVPISAKTGIGIDELLDTILLTAELENFTGEENAMAEGIVVESHKDPQKGITGTVIIKEGTLNKGEFVACGKALSPVRSLINQNAESVDQITFSSPVAICGWNMIPNVGTLVKAFKNKKDAEEYCRNYKEETSTVKLNSEEMTNSTVIIPIIIKTDVLGTLDAIIHEIQKIKVENIAFKIIDSGTGNIGEADMKNAGGSEGAVVLGFGVGMDAQAEAIRERDSITTKTFTIIYELAEFLKDIAETRRPRIAKEVTTGIAKIMRTFSNNKNHHVVGGKVKEGSIRKGSEVKILRRDEEIGKGIIKELQTQKVKVEEIKEGEEFGMMIDSKMELAEGDSIEAYKVVTE